MFTLNWTARAQNTFKELESAAKRVSENRKKKGNKKSSLQEGLFKQVVKTLKFLQSDPRHPGLKTHIYHSLIHPWSKEEKVFEAYAQNNAPAAFRVFWCYGPKKREITIIAITQHP